MMARPVTVSRLLYLVIIDSQACFSHPIYTFIMMARYVTVSRLLYLVMIARHVSATLSIPSS
jgi:hypothetical protein